MYEQTWSSIQAVHSVKTACDDLLLFVNPVNLCCELLNQHLADLETSERF